MPGEEAQAIGPQVMMMPFFMGAPWIQKFKGIGSEVKLAEWRSQIEAMLSIQQFGGEQKTEFVLGALDGEAKREILAIDKGNRDTPGKIFSVLKELYGDRAPIAALRTQFFNCKQESNEPLRAFSLRLRELFSRLRCRDPTGLEQADLLLRDQFIMGLQEGVLRQELRRQVRRDERMSFDEVKREALFHESEQEGERWIPPACLAVEKPSPTRPPAQFDWKQEFKRELLQEVQGQISELTQTLLSELRGEAQRPKQLPLTDHARDTSAGRPRGGLTNQNGFPVRSGNKWDMQGRPICNACGAAGHISRYCRQNASETTLN